MTYTDGFRAGRLDFLNGVQSRYLYALLPQEPGFEYARGYRAAQSQEARRVYEKRLQEAKEKA